jgi:antitoxin PrlF
MVKYTGSITTSGKSEAIRFEKGLFRQNPEFRQQAKVEARIIGPGQMLVSVVDESEQSPSEDPIVMAFLSFLERDMTENPKRISPVSEESINRAKQLTKDVVVSDDDTISDDVSF